MFFNRQKIEGIFDVAMQEVAPGEIGAFRRAPAVVDASVASQAIQAIHEG